MKTQEAIMQEIIEESRPPGSYFIVERLINHCRADPDLARYIRQRMNEIIKEAEKHGE